MHIIFDLDGTLLDPFPRLYQIHVDLAKKYNFPALSLRAYRQMKRNKIPEKVWYEKERRRLLENAYYISLDRLYPSILHVLKTLKKQKHHLYLVTVRKNKKTLMDQLYNLKIDNYFENILVPKSKEGIKISSQHAETIIVGDTEADILFGKQNKFITVAVLYGMRSKSFLYKLKPDYLIDNLKRLPYIVEVQNKILHL